MKKYQTILIDPPWEYSKKIAGGGANSSSDRKYPILSLDELRTLPISEITKEDSHLYVWTTNNLLSSTVNLINEWGFQYRNIIVWVKTYKDGLPILGMGFYYRNSVEFLLFCTKRDIVSRIKTANTKNVFFAERKSHSEKPEVQYDLIEKNSNGPYLEMFARRKREGWDSWGNEIKSDIVLKI